MKRKQGFIVKTKDISWQSKISHLIKNVITTKIDNILNWVNEDNCDWQSRGQISNYLNVTRQLPTTRYHYDHKKQHKWN